VPITGVCSLADQGTHKQFHIQRRTRNLFVCTMVV